MRQRCGWGEEDPTYLTYHDDEWGVPVHDDRLLFEFLILEGMQAGLSWLTILKKRQAFRRAFDRFDAAAVAGYGEGKIADLMQDASIVRNRRKIEAAVANARATLAIRQEFGSLDRFLWSFVDGRPMQNGWRRLEQIPASTTSAAAMSLELKRRGFRFVGPTICYAFMQAVGMVNDHLVGCYRHKELGGADS